MWTPSNTHWRAARLEVRTLRLPLHKSFTKVAPRRAIVERPTCHIELPQRLWDRIILFMFICCLFIFLHALLGFGIADYGLNASNHTFRAPLLTSPLRAGWNAVESNDNRKILVQGGARVVVDWHGNYYEIFPSTTSDGISTATSSRTSALFGSEHRTAGRGSHPINIKAETSASIPVTLDGNLYEPFPVGSAEGGEDHGRYLVTKRPKIASPRTRKRRFGRCLPEDVCL